MSDFDKQLEHEIEQELGFRIDANGMIVGGEKFRRENPGAPFGTALWKALFAARKEAKMLRQAYEGE
jgi:hypothetical protein